MLLVVVGELQRQGFDPRPFLEGTGFHPSWAHDTEVTIPWDTVRDVAFRAIEATGDPCFGVHMAEHTRPERVGLHTYIASTSATLREALTRVIRYMPLLSNLAIYSLVEAGDEAQVTVEAPAGTPVYSMQWNVTVNHCFIRALVDAPWTIREARFSHAAPSAEAAREYERVFGAPVRFSTPGDGIRFDRKLLDAPMKNRDDRVCQALEKLARAQIAAVGVSDEVASRVRREVLELPADAEIRLGTIARRLAMGARTLQRRLGAEGTSLRAIVDSVRFERARAYLAMEGMSSADVAFLLGFGDAAAFHRAFQRWAGETPQTYRRRRG